LQADEGDLSGNGVVNLQGSMDIDATLRSSKLDLDAALKAFGIALKLPATPAGSSGPIIPDIPVPWAALRGPKINFVGAIKAVTFQDREWRDVELALQLASGRLQVGTMKLALPAGPLELSLTADASSAALPVSLAVDAPGVPLALVVHYAGLPGAVEGAVRVNARLHGTGRSARDLAGSLGGSLSLTAIGGQMTNAALIALASPALDALSIKVPAQGETALHCLGLVGTFSKGVGRFRTIALETTYLTLDGVGEVNLGKETVALKLNPLAQISGSSVEVPVVIEGPFRAIKGRLDASGLDKVGLLIDSWFGGDQPDACSDAGLVHGRTGSP
jgi:AsmA protein